MFPTATISAILRDKPTLTYGEACSVASRRGHALRAMRKDRAAREEARKQAQPRTRHWWQD